MLPVFPCEPSGKRPLTRHGFQDASKNPDQLRSWWTEHRLANLAIPTGGDSGLVVVDVDPRNGGTVGLENLLAAHGRSGFDETPTVTTGGGGIHFWFAAPATRVAGCVLAPGVDLKAEGGYVIAPPSRHPSGASYEWRLHPDDTPFAPLPEWIRARTGEPAGSPGTAQPLPETISEYRNVLLTSLAGSMRRRGASEAAILAALETENTTRCVPPLESREVTRIAHSVMRYAPAGLTLAEVPTSTTPGAVSAADADAGSPVGATPDSPPAPPPDVRLTDLGNAELFARLYSDRLRAVAGQGWIHWDGKVWQRDTDGTALRFAFAAVRSLYLAAAAATDAPSSRRIGKHAVNSEGSRKLKAIPELAASLATVRTDPEALDADPMLLAVQNGVLNLSTGTLHPHAAYRDHYLTRLAPVTYDPNATESEWSRFLWRIMNGNTNLLAFLQRTIGYALTGQTREQTMFILYGAGRNGKSTFMEAIRATLGPYTTTTTADTLLTKYAAGGIPNDIARLRGARLVTAGELNQGRRIDAALVKRLVSEDTITARFLRHEFFEFRPTFKIFLHTNHKPEVTDSSEAMWRRVRLIPFTVNIPPDEVDQHLLEKLASEKSGILNWAVNGCLDWQARGLHVPEEVERATLLYRHEEDRTQLFLDECCESGEDLRISSKSLYERFKTWSEGIGEKPAPLRTFNSSITEHGFHHITVRMGQNTTRGWSGLRIKNTDPISHFSDSD